MSTLIHDDTSLLLRIASTVDVADGIRSFELVQPDGSELPPFTAGSHVKVRTPNGAVRKYSLCNSPAERHRYVIGVLRDEAGRGGSKALHASLRVQDMVSVGLPRNNFPVADHAARHILIAGGIGLTPLKAMAHQLERAGRERPGGAAVERLLVCREPWTAGALDHRQPGRVPTGDQ